VNGVVALLAVVATSGAAHPTDCKVTQTASPPYVLTVTCTPDCKLQPKPLTVNDLVSEGVERKVAAAIVKLRNTYWHRACDRTL